MATQTAYTKPFRGRMSAHTRLSDWDPTYMSWAPATGARSSSAWSQPVLVGAPVPQMDTNFAAVIDDDGRLVGMWRCVPTLSPSLVCMIFD